MEVKKEFVALKSVIKSEEFSDSLQENSEISESAQIKKYVSAPICHVNSDMTMENKSSPKLDVRNKSKQKFSSDFGPGAEVKGKIGHPVPSSSGGVDANLEEQSNLPSDNSTNGGRLTFFQEGRPLLELSHKSEQPSWVQVKNKTYWPPSSIANLTQHTIRYDSLGNNSDDFSSLNSSPWSNDHARKQTVPIHRGKIIQIDEFAYKAQSKIMNSIRLKLNIRRIPFYKVIDPVNDLKIKKSPSAKVSMKNKKGKNLKITTTKLWKNIGAVLNVKATIQSLFEKIDCKIENEEPFLTPRKRYLKSMDDNDTHSKKKHSILNQLKNCDKKSSHSPNKSAISSQLQSPYSIDSLLASNNSERKDDSFLRTLLKSEKKDFSYSTSKDRDSKSPHLLSRHLERPQSHSPFSKEKSLDYQRRSSSVLERSDTTNDFTRYSSPHASLSNPYLSHYLDPRYMMLHSQIAAASPQPFLPNSAIGNQNDISSVLASVAAAGYPINPLQLTALAANGCLLPSTLPPSPSYSPAAAHVPSSPVSYSSCNTRSPNHNRASPLASNPHSPSPKLSAASLNINHRMSPIHSSSSHLPMPASLKKHYRDINSLSSLPTLPPREIYPNNSTQLNHLNSTQIQRSLYSAAASPPVPPRDIYSSISHRDLPQVKRQTVSPFPRSDPGPHISKYNSSSPSAKKWLNNDAISPHKFNSSPPPTQDAPLNLSKPKKC